MGGMIAQTIAARHPDRVLSLVSIMSNTGSRLTGQPAFSVVPLMIKTAPADREGYAEHVVSVFAAVGSPDFPRDDDEVRERARLSWDRSYDPAGSARQLAAINASGNRRAEVRRIKAPTLVIHGQADKLVHRSGGSATARLIDGAQIMKVEGMGHDLPRAVWPRIVDGIVATARRAGFEPRQAAALSA
jgi:pimeloyl-ACP methyl ester carboxylesterase